MNFQNLIFLQLNNRNLDSLVFKKVIISIYFIDKIRYNIEDYRIVKVIIDNFFIEVNDLNLLVLIKIATLSSFSIYFII